MVSNLTCDFKSSLEAGGLKLFVTTVASVEFMSAAFSTFSPLSMSKVLKFSAVSEEMFKALVVFEMLESAADFFISFCFITLNENNNIALSNEFQVFLKVGLLLVCPCLLAINFFQVFFVRSMYLFCNLQPTQLQGNECNTVVKSLRALLLNTAS